MEWRNKVERLFKVFTWVIILLLLVSAGFPLLVTISTSLQSHSEVYASSPVLLPAKPQWHNYVDAMQNGNWGRYLFNSAYVTLWTLVLSLAINSMAGYALARIRFRGRAAVLALTLAGLMIPPQVTMIPVFTMLRSMPLAGGNDLLGQGGTGLMNTYGGLILPYIAGSFGVFLMRQFYVSFPAALDDAARIDGCGRLRTFLRIYVPLSGPAFASLCVTKFTGAWNEDTGPLVMTHTDDMKTVQLALPLFRDEGEIRWNQLMAATLVASVPIYIVFLLTQKHFVSGLLVGSVKG